jgi:hypothetical protein
MEKLLTRDVFKVMVFKRSAGRCTFCECAAVDAHHIYDRKLYPNTGGYFLSNGAAVCERHHWECETTIISVEDVCAAAQIVEPVLPDCLDASLRYDKWGNEIRVDGTRSPGPLFGDDGARKALALGGKLGLFY